MVSVLFALLTALFNGLASVLQRMAASTAPAAKTLHLSLFTYLFKHKVWLAGIGMVVVASVCQAIALATGPVALVQPIFIIELPFTLLVASRLAMIGSGCRRLRRKPISPSLLRPAREGLVEGKTTTPGHMGIFGTDSKGKSRDVRR